MQRVIEATTTIRAVHARARDVLADDPAVMLGDGFTAEERRARRFPIELAVNIGAGASVHQGVLIHVGAVRASEDDAVVPIAWHATGHERLLPSFDGELHLLAHKAGSSLRLAGAYSVPLGPVGRFGDGIAGRRLARQSLAALVEQIARRLDAEVARRVESIAWRPAPYPVALREEHHPEIYVG